MHPSPEQIAAQTESNLQDLYDYAQLQQQQQQQQQQQHLQQQTEPQQTNNL